MPDAIKLLGDLERNLHRDDSLVRWACEEMLAGHESPSLVRLAGLVPAEYAEAPDLFRRSVRELGYAVPERRELLLYSVKCDGTDIREDPEREVVTVDGHEIAGSILDEICGRCRTPRIYSERYDLVFCPVCKDWPDDDDPGCGDPDCPYCSDRPIQLVPRP